MADDTLAGFRSLVSQTALATDKKTKSVSDQVDDLLKTQARSDARTDFTRMGLAIGIITVYAGSIAVVLFWFGSRIPHLSSGPLPPTLDPYSAAVMDILKVLVLPVVTLMLGFYFGTGSLIRQTQHKAH